MKIIIEIEVETLDDAIEKIINRIKTIPKIPDKGSILVGIEDGIGTIEIINKES